MFDMAQMMKQAQEMQYKLQEVQEKLVDMEVESEAGGGLVKVRMSCGGKILGINLDPSLLEGDKETLEDLLIAALNNANNAKEEKIKDETTKMMESMDLPPEMAGKGGLPF